MAMTSAAYVFGICPSTAQQANAIGRINSYVDERVVGQKHCLGSTLNPKPLNRGSVKHSQNAGNTSAQGRVGLNPSSPVGAELPSHRVPATAPIP